MSRSVGVAGRAHARPRARREVPTTATGSIAIGRRTLALLTVRARLLAAVVALSAVAVLTAGGSAFALQTRATDARIDNSLSRAVAALRVVETSADPTTGLAWTRTSLLLEESVRSQVPSENEGVLTFIDSTPRWYAALATQALRLDEDPVLVSVLEAVPPSDPVRTRTVRTPTTEYRLVTVPASIAGDAEQGVFVVAYDRTAELASLHSSFRTFLAVGGLALAIIALVAWFVVGRLLRPVRLLRDTTRRITESDLSERIDVSGRDDLSDLARTVNAMLGRLERAFGSQRELVDDVGHELRTPLTVVRGHLELLDPRDPDDVRATQALALDELDRMQRLVNDLVTLATADRPDFVRYAPTDIGRLTDDVHDKARGLGDRRWVVAARADVVVQLDAQRITQAWLQLLANAHRYSDPGSTVRLGSEVAGDRLLIWVRDEGSGVPPEEMEQIFERFHRGRADRTTHGAGLGLPIVAAIAAAHHGRVFVEQPPAHVGSGGAVFVLDLPARDLVVGETRRTRSRALVRR
ncbi:cell wall metabolism sensor histidine kinase WalK [Cellulomonas sp. URHD0024]|uniref:sensor histidine kinase n=1 Tax=Cellulomonas sp. URHD0024 TaxID=1302620 RepID=UPI00042749ED|nr:HAMP domain-containing sensor histidine kinase [Cellulomonas sp. URHD0024]